MTIRPDDIPHRHVFIGVSWLYLASSAFLLGLAALVTWVGGDWVGFPLAFWDVWAIPADVAGGLTRVLPLFVWGVVLTVALGLILIARRAPRDARPSTVFIRGTWLSLNAGFFEEIIFRWLLLLIAPAVLTVLNFITFGLVKWFYLKVLIPVADWITLGLLEPQLTAANWLLGAAIISVNGRFRQGHLHNGFLAGLNAWFIGMLMFYLLFNHGIWAAIVAHILYDLCVFWTASVMTTFQPRYPRYWL